MPNSLKKIFIVILILLISYVGIFKIFNIPNKIMKKIYPKEYSEYVEKYAEEYNIDSLLIYAVIKSESKFNEKSVSNSNAKGVMQLMDSTADEVAKNMLEFTTFDSEMLFDAKINIQIGTKYLSDLISKYNRKLLYCFSCL